MVNFRRNYKHHLQRPFFHNIYFISSVKKIFSWKSPSTLALLETLGCINFWLQLLPEKYLPRKILCGFHSSKLFKVFPDLSKKHFINWNCFPTKTLCRRLLRKLLYLHVFLNLCWYQLIILLFLIII